MEFSIFGIYRNFQTMYKQALFFFALLIIAQCSAQLTAASTQDTPKLPIYAGMGYNILEGNPLHSDRVDPGFTHTVFSFTYDNEKLTEDRNYLVPDQLQQTKVTSCSYSVQVGEYRGTQSYQKQLSIKASVNGQYDGLIAKSSFSLSSSYQEMNNSTVSSNQSVTQAIAECQNYKLGVNLFVIDNLSPNFETGALNSYKNGNWSEFFIQFGSHFAYQVIMGGRAIQEISYKQQSVSVLRSMGVDLSVAAKASFAKFVGDASFDYSSYQNEASYAETYRYSKKEIYIGGKPSLDGNLTEWQLNVIQDPMPINYKFLPLTQLFDEVQAKYPSSFNHSNAITQYQLFLENYCKKIGCKAPTVDDALPNAAQVVVSFDNQQGGSGGSSFSWKQVSPTMNLKKVIIRCGQQIDRIQIMIGDEVQNLYSGQYGGSGGSVQTWQVPKGEYVKQIQYRAGNRIDSLTFITNKGNKSQKFGKSGGGYRLHTLPDDARIIGIQGKSGSRLDKLGFIFGTTQYKTGATTSSILLVP